MTDGGSGSGDRGRRLGRWCSSAARGVCAGVALAAPTLAFALLRGNSEWAAARWGFFAGLLGVTVWVRTLWREPGGRVSRVIVAGLCVFGLSALGVLAFEPAFRDPLLRDAGLAALASTAALGAIAARWRRTAPMEATGDGGEPGRPVAIIAVSWGDYPLTTLVRGASHSVVVGPVARRGVDLVLPSQSSFAAIVRPGAGGALQVQAPDATESRSLELGERCSIALLDNVSVSVTHASGVRWRAAPSFDWRLPRAIAGSVALLCAVLSTSAATTPPEANLDEFDRDRLYELFRLNAAAAEREEERLALSEGESAHEPRFGSTYVRDNPDSAPRSRCADNPFAETDEGSLWAQDSCDAVAELRAFALAPDPLLDPTRDPLLYRGPAFGAPEAAHVVVRDLDSPGANPADGAPDTSRVVSELAAALAPCIPEMMSAVEIGLRSTPKGWQVTKYRRLGPEGGSLEPPACLLDAVKRLRGPDTAISRRLSAGYEP